jgi:HPt (histidine-containing phosphotransfer) domain-containing protein
MDQPHPYDPVAELHTIRTELAALAVQLEMDMSVDLIDLFRQTCELIERQIREGLQNNDADVVRRAAHTLKGTAAQLGAFKLSEMAKTVEIHARQSDMSQAAETAGPMVDAMHALLHTMAGAF